MPLSDAELASLAQQLRRDSILSTTEAGSGHPTTCMSAADIVAVLFGREMEKQLGLPPPPDPIATPAEISCS